MINDCPQPGHMLSAPPVEPPEDWAPDEATTLLARMVLAAASPAEREQIIMIMNHGVDPLVLTSAIEPIYD